MHRRGVGGQGASYESVAAKLTREQRDSLWARVEGESKQSCWRWTGGHLPAGYATTTFWIDGRHQGGPAHRIIYELLVGPIPEGLDLDHVCRNKGCVNPWHMEPVTRQENIRRRDLALYPERAYRTRWIAPRRGTRHKNLGDD